MIKRSKGTVKMKHETCYMETMLDVQIGYRCTVCGLFIHKESNKFKNQEKKL